MGLKVIVGYATPTQPITRSICDPSHVQAIHAMMEIEARQPWDMEKQQFVGKHLEWRVVEDE
jgi:hypothetical protein